MRPRWWRAVQAVTQAQRCCRSRLGLAVARLVGATLSGLPTSSVKGEATGVSSGDRVKKKTGRLDTRTVVGQGGLTQVLTFKQGKPPDQCLSMASADALVCGMALVGQNLHGQQSSYLYILASKLPFHAIDLNIE